MQMASKQLIHPIGPKCKKTNHNLLGVKPGLIAGFSMPGARDQNVDAKFRIVAVGDFGVDGYRLKIAVQGFRAPRLELDW